MKQKIVTNAGKVNFVQNPQDVSFLVKFNDVDGSEYLKRFTLKIVGTDDEIYLRQKTDEDIVREDIEYIIKYLKDTYNLNNITDKLSLPIKGNNNKSVISYLSNNTIALSNIREIKRGTKDEKVTLTVNVSCGSEKMSDSIDMLVKAAEIHKIDNSGKGSGGGPTVSIRTVTGTTDKPPVYFETNELSNTQNPNEEKNNAEFNDVGKQHWAYEGIMNLKKAGIISGDDSNMFNPDDIIKREEAAKMILGYSNIDIAKGDVSREDVDPKAWYYPYVKTLILTGIAKGYSEKHFGIGDCITREDFIVLINNITYKINDIQDNIEKFGDDELISDYAAPAVYALKGHNIVMGTDGKINPKDYITRAEAAAIINRLSSVNQ